MAAVRVVLPWSMCPIVPTFTCGFVRSNFFFAICFQSHIVCFNPDWALLANVTGRISIPYGNELFFCFNFQSHMGVACQNPMQTSVWWGSRGQRQLDPNISQGSRATMVGIEPTT